MPGEERDRLDLLLQDDMTFFSRPGGGNAFISFGLTLKHLRVRGLEWRNNLIIIPRRIRGVMRRDEDDNILLVKEQYGEYGLESSGTFGIPFARYFNLYVGTGTMMNLSSRRRTCVSLSPSISSHCLTNGHLIAYSSTFESGREFKHLFYLQTGLGMQVFKSIEFEVMAQGGAGYVIGQGEPIKYMNWMGMSIGLRYVIDQTSLSDLSDQTLTSF